MCIGMPRSLRIEYEGALYHVLNRGNYRQGVFAADASREAFLSTLWAASSGKRPLFGEGAYGCRKD